MKSKKRQNPSRTAEGPEQGRKRGFSRENVEAVQINKSFSGGEVMRKAAHVELLPLLCAYSPLGDRCTAGEVFSGLFI